MKKQKYFQLATIAVLVFAVLFMAIGFATYSQTLKINGTVNVAKNKWSVHFSTLASDYQLETGSVAADSHSVTETQVNFTASLAKPGDHHTFTVQAALKSIDMSALTEAQAKYLTYTLKYGDTTYDSSVSGLNIALPVNSSEEVMIDVRYVQPADPADLPAEDVVVNLSAQLNYEQAN